MFGPQTIFTGPFNMVFVPGLYEMHENICVSRVARKKCGKTQENGRDMKEEACLWKDVGEKLVMRKDDELCSQ